MKYIGLLFLIMSFLPTDRGSVQWVVTYQEGEFLSRQENKLIMLYFWSPTNEACRRMDVETMTRESIITLTSSFVPIQVDFDSESDITGRFRIQSIPQVVIVDSYGIVIDRLKGLRSSYKAVPSANNVVQPEVLEAITSAKLERFLGKYPSNITLINNAQEKLAKDKTDINAIFEVAEAYLLTSVDAYDSGITNFIAEANTYLGMAKKLLKKQNNKALMQRYEILTVCKELYRQNPTKGLKKYFAYKKSKKINKENIAITSASLYVAYNQLKQKSKAKAQIELLKSADGSQKFVDYLNL